MARHISDESFNWVLNRFREKYAVSDPNLRTGKSPVRFEVLVKVCEDYSDQRLREFGEKLISEMKATVEWPEDEYFPGLNTACHIISENLEELGERK